MTVTVEHLFSGKKQHTYTLYIFDLMISVSKAAKARTS